MDFKIIEILCFADILRLAVIVRVYPCSQFLDFVTPADFLFLL